LGFFQAARCNELFEHWNWNIRLKWTTRLEIKKDIVANAMITDEERVFFYGTAVCNDVPHWRGHIHACILID
jgi:hypothetical protein